MSSLHAIAVFDPRWYTNTIVSTCADVDWDGTVGVLSSVVIVIGPPLPSTVYHSVTPIRAPFVVPPAGWQPLPTEPARPVFGSPFSVVFPVVSIAENWSELRGSAS